MPTPEDDFLWHTLQRTQAPILLYGMGDGADKILAACARYAIPVAGVFASDGFVRGQSFRGFPVLTLARAEAQFPAFTALLCFASQRPDVLADIKALAARHTLLVPDVPVVGDTLVTPAFLAERAGDIARLESLLADEQSLRVFRDVLRYKLTGRPDYLWRCESDRREVFEQLLRPGPDEVLVDAGAYTGDTVEEFLQYTGGRYGRILALEPDPRNFRKLAATRERLGLTRMECLQLGAWSRTDRLPFNHKSGRQAAFGEAVGAATVPVDSIDHLLGGDGATFLKLDVEGAEREALLGAAETIRRHRPKLAVSVYHRGEDLLDLPLLLHALCPAYRLYLRHHPYLPAWETNCYAII